jgi:hypothetical protein
MAIEEGVDILMKTAVNLLGAKTKMKKEEPLPLKKGDQAEPAALARLMSRSKWWPGEESIRWELGMLTVICKTESDSSLGVKNFKSMLLECGVCVF